MMFPNLFGGGGQTPASGGSGFSLGGITDWLNKMRPSAEGSPLAPPGAGSFGAAGRGVGGFLSNILGGGGLHSPTSASGPVSEMEDPRGTPAAAPTSAADIHSASNVNQADMKARYQPPTLEQIMATINGGVTGPSVPGMTPGGMPPAPQMQMPELHPMLAEFWDAARLRRDV